uniref:Uncharacterized protein n=1 Tax=Avena sativa TaxID=4498 RepID=A0ACD5Z8B5_AVESA
MFSTHSTEKIRIRAPVNSVAIRNSSASVDPFSASSFARKPMATVTGGAVLQPRVPSSSVPALEPLRGRRRAPSVRCASMRRTAARGRPAMDEDHYRTLSLAPGATRGEVKKAFHRLALQYHPDVVRRGEDDGDDNNMDFQRINQAYQRVMDNMRGTEARLEYWRARYGLADEDLDRYRRYLHDEEADDWFADL